MEFSYLFPTYFIQITTFLLLLSSNIGKVAELWTLTYRRTKHHQPAADDCGAPLVVGLRLGVALHTLVSLDQEADLGEEPSTRRRGRFPTIITIVSLKIIIKRMLTSGADD